MKHKISERFLDETIEFWDKWLNRNKTANVAEFMVYGGRALDACMELKYYRKEMVRHAPCENAEKEAGGKCLGYSNNGDDEPIEKCKSCINYTSYEDGGAD